MELPTELNLTTLFEQLACPRMRRRSMTLSKHIRWIRTLNSSMPTSGHPSRRNYSRNGCGPMAKKRRSSMS